MDQKKIITNKKNIPCVSYRTNEFFDRSPVKEYSRFVPDYKFDSDNQKIVIVGKIDFQDKIQSNSDCDYRKVFDKYLDNSYFDTINLFGDQFVENSDEVVESNFLSDKLTDTMNLFQLADEYKSKLSLDPNMSPDEVFKYLNNFATKLGELNKNNIEKFKQNIEKGEEDETN